jgi:hypothetical protein
LEYNPAVTGDLDTAMTEFTLVRHGGYAVGGDTAFEGAVEVCEITEKQAYLVRAAGGMVFTTREAAQAAEHAVNTTKNVAGAGFFSSLRIGGAEIHVPR